MKETLTMFYTWKVSIKLEIPTPAQLKNVIYSQCSRRPHGENIDSIPKKRETISTSVTLTSTHSKSHFDNVAKSSTMPSIRGLSSYEDIYGEDSDEDKWTTPESPLESRDNSTMPISTYRSQVSESTELVFDDTSLSTMTDMSALTPTSLGPTSTEVEQSLPSAFSPATMELDESMAPSVRYISCGSEHSHRCSRPTLKRHTVKVEGVQADWDKTVLKIAFTDREKGGGELEVRGIKMQGNVALIKFKDSQG